VTTARWTTVAFLCAAIIACDAGPPREIVEDPEGRFTLGLIEPGTLVQDGGRVAWRLPESGVTVAVQRVAKTDHVMEDRILDDVARAMDTRYSYEEVTGAIERHPCTVAGANAYCLEAWTRGRPGAPRAKALRRGVLVDAGDELLLVEAVGPAGASDAVDRQYRALLVGLRLDAQRGEG